MTKLIKEQVYNGEEYTDEFELRQAIFKKEHKAFPKEPLIGKVSFQKKYNVQYTETEWYPTDIEKLEIAKSQRSSDVAKITVEVNGMIFNGDEKSIQRMSEVITSALALEENFDETHITQTLADDTEANPSIREIAQALKQATEKRTALQRIPYEV